MARVLYRTVCQSHRSLHILFSRHLSSEVSINHKVWLDPDVHSMISNKEIKVKKHPGIMQVKTVSLPNRLQDAIDYILEKYPTKDLVTKAEHLARYLWSRQLPPEPEEIRQRTQQIAHNLQKKDGTNPSQLTPEEREKYENKLKDQTIKRLRYQMYHWQPTEYDAYRGLQYLVARMAEDFSILVNVFSEIQKREHDFKPRSLFDFGSGVGSVVWAANHVWKNSLYEHLCVDPSEDMQTIARLLLQDGKEEKEMCYKQVYFRPVVPVLSKEDQHHLVVSAFTLMELPNQEARLNAILGLWDKTDEFLILVENGTNAGYRVIMEARDFILKWSKSEAECTDSEESLKSRIGHVFAPCPHDLNCPRQIREDGTPCNFERAYQPSRSVSATKKSVRYCYLVMKKGIRKEGVSWPRIVRPVLTPAKHVHCVTCTAHGKLERAVITAKKHGKPLYGCAKASRWGDLLPVQSATPETNSTNTETSTDTQENKNPISREASH